MRAINDYLLYLSAERNLSLCTIKAYSSDIRQFVDFCLRARGRMENNDLGDIDHQFLRRYLAYLQTKRLSRRSVARKLAALRSFYSFLQGRGIIRKNPIDLITSPKVESHLPKVMSYIQIISLLDTVDCGRPLGLRDRAIIETLYGGGVRVSELVNLNLPDINFSDGEIKVLGKGAKERLVPVNWHMELALRSYLEKGRVKLIKAGRTSAHTALFLNYYGTRLSSCGVRKMINRYAKKAGIPGVTPHVFRHSFATHLLEGNAGLRVVQELLGHVDLSSTQIYTHLSKKQLKKIYNQAHPRA